MIRCRIFQIGIASSIMFSTTSLHAADRFARIETEEAFVEAVVGKTLIYKDGAQIVFLEDRTFGGTFSGSRIWGEWKWRAEDQKVCHQMNVGEKRYKVDCRTPEMSGKRIQFRREDGSFYGVARIE